MASRTCEDDLSAHMVRPTKFRRQKTDLRLHLGEIHDRFIHMSVCFCPRHKISQRTPTILNLTNPGLEVVKGQIADLGLQTVEIHACGGGSSTGGRVVGRRDGEGSKWVGWVLMVQDVAGGVEAGSAQTLPRLISRNVDNVTLNSKWVAA